MRIGRRAFTLGLATGIATTRDQAESDEDPLEVTALHLDHEVVLALPRASAPPAPLVVLLHGLAETSDEHVGARAWIDRYGLASSVRRLTRAAPSASASPYAGLAFACPYVPRMPASKLDAYALWLTGTLLPHVRAEAGARIDASPARIGGCSYGGWVSLEVFLRASDSFRAWAGVQTAISSTAASAYADRLARVAPARPLLVETSTRDPFHDANVALAQSLRARHVACDLVVLPGPHDQPWLRESGTPAMLAWLATGPHRAQ